MGALARGWSVPGRNCSFVVVTNLNETAPQQVDLNVVSRIYGVSYDGDNATRMFDAVYSVAVSATGNMRVFVDAGGTNVYSLGDCVNVTNRAGM